MYNISKREAYLGISFLTVGIIAGFVGHDVINLDYRLRTENKRLKELNLAQEGNSEKLKDKYNTANNKLQERLDFSVKSTANERAEYVSVHAQEVALFKTEEHPTQKKCNEMIKKRLRKEFEGSRSRYEESRKNLCGQLDICSRTGQVDYNTKESCERYGAPIKMPPSR